MKSNVDQDFDYIVNFWAVDESEIMYLDKGKPIYIYKEDFNQFSKANVLIQLKKYHKSLDLFTKWREWKLVNDANGTCLCKSSTSLVNVKRKQILVEKQLKKIVSIFLGSTTSMKMKLSKTLYNCLDAFIKGDICGLSDLRKKGHFLAHILATMRSDGWQMSSNQISNGS